MFSAERRIALVPSGDSDPIVAGKVSPDRSSCKTRLFEQRQSLTTLVGTDLEHEPTPLTQVGRSARDDASYVVETIGPGKQSCVRLPVPHRTIEQR